MFGAWLRSIERQAIVGPFYVKVLQLFLLPGYFASNAAGLRTELRKVLLFCLIEAVRCLSNWKTFLSVNKPTVVHFIIHVFLVFGYSGVWRIISRCIVRNDKAVEAMLRTSVIGNLAIRWKMEALVHEHVDER